MMRLEIFHFRARFLSFAVMQKSKMKFVLFVLLMSVSLLASACGGVQSATNEPSSVSVPPAARISADENSIEKIVRFLENKIKNDPEDYSASSKLAGLYLQKLRETGNAQYLELAFRFYADHDIKPDEAYQLAAKEYEVRKDIYGADALAWTALKAGKLTEAQTAIKDALRLGTNDARILYHAALIARASGDETAARGFLQRALKLNSQFDPLHSAIAPRHRSKSMTK